MNVAFLIPLLAPNRGSAIATHHGRIIVATTPAELREVPPAWEPVDLDKIGRVSVTEWIGDLGGR